jgi:hypothetical protein
MRFQSKGITRIAPPMYPHKNRRRFQTFCLFIAYAYGSTCVCSTKLTAEQDRPPSDQSLLVQPLDAPAPTQESASTPSSGNGSQQTSGKKEEEKKKKKEKKESNGSFVIAPIPIVSPAIGSGFIPIVGYITPIPQKERKETPSVIGAGGLITNNGSRGFFVGTDLYFNQARYEVESVYIRGSLDYSLYGTGFINGSTNLKLPLEQTGQGFFIKGLRLIRWKTYVGARFTTGNSFITLMPTSGTLPPIPPEVGLHTALRSLGVEVSRDSRPNRFYPVKGSVFDFTGDFFSQFLGSKYSYQSYKITFNKYFSLPKKQVLAYNAFFCATGGTPPFYGNCIYGTNNELRGYTAGRYLDRYMVATQLEDRLELPWRLGVVGFVGLGGVDPGVAAFRTSHFLPGGGTGIRFMLSKSYHVNLRTDFAWGRDNFTWGVGVGEAF